MVMMRLSVLICCYNQDKYIRQTIDSIIRQVNEDKDEIIICDDASSDSTHLILNEYKNLHPNLLKVIIRPKNLGLINNYYDGITRAVGEYIMVCAGDDYWLENKVKTQIEYMNMNPSCGLCYGAAKKINESGLIIGKLYGKNNNTFETLIKNDHIVAPTMCFRKSVLERYIREVNPLSHTWLMEDYPFILWCSKFSRIDYIDNELAAYRYCITSSCRPTSLYKKIEFIESVKNVKEYFACKCDRCLQSEIISNYIERLLRINNGSEEYKALCKMKIEMNVQNRFYRAIYKARLNNKCIDYILRAVNRVTLLLSHT